MEIKIRYDWNQYVGIMKSGNQAMITLDLKGSNFPAYQASLVDEAENEVYFNTYSAGSRYRVFVNLWGDNHRQAGLSNLTINLDENANSKSVTSLEKEYTLEQWNQGFESMPASSGLEKGEGGK